MKNYIKKISYFVSILALVTMVSCDEDDDFASVDINNINVASAFPLDPVSLEGTNFNTIEFVFVGTQQADFTLDGNTVTFLVPENASIGPTKVTLAMANNYRETVGFEVLLRPNPVIQSVSSSAVSPGGELTIKGVSFNSEFNTAVTIGGVSATINSNNGSEMVVLVPDGLPLNQSADIEVTSIHGVATSDFLFFVGENTLANGGLELGDGDEFTNWGKWNGGDGMTATSNPNEAYFGRSLKAIGDGRDAWRTQFVSDPALTTVGVEYTGIIWIKAEATGGNMRFSTNEAAGAQYSGNYDISTEWQQIQWVFTATSPETRLVLDMGATSSTFFVDNITLVESAGGSQGSPELLLNGSFEDGLTNWETLNGAHDVSTAEFYCGTTSMTSTGTGGNPWDVQLASDPMLLTVGTDYEISFWAKAAGPDGVFRISMSQYDGNGADFFYSPDLDIPEDWTYFSFVTTAQTTASGDMRLLFDMGATTQTFFVDGVSVKEYDPPASLYTNGDFEDGLNGWETLNGTHEASADAYTGTGSMTATGVGANPWDVQIATDPLALTVGTDYKISFWAKAAGPDGVFRISMSQYDGNGADFFYSPDLDITEDWSYFSFVITAQATASGDHRLLFDMGATTQTFFVDDVVVVEYNACE